MADVFLSYARANSEQAQSIASDLRAAGFSVWFDERLPAHRDFSEVIEEQLNHSSAVLVLWSTASVRSQWVRSEANRARERGCLVQARIDEARLPMPFDQIQCADLRSRAANGPAWATVLESIAELTSAERPSPSARAGHSRSDQYLSRRTVLTAVGAAAAVGVAGVAYLRRPLAPDLSPEAQLLLQKGMDALQQNDSLEPLDAGSTLQAIALLEDATAAAPRSSVAWGALAMAFAARKRVAPVAERAGLDARSRSAAKNALEIDPREARALGALRMLEPVYRNWFHAEQGDRAALQKNPRLPILLFIMSDMLGQVGRWKDASSYSKQFDRRKFLIPGADRKLIIDLWCTGDLTAADRALEAAVRQWPLHPQIWRTRMAFLMYTGRPQEALSLLRGGADRPPELSTSFLDAVATTAEALADRGSAPKAISRNLELLRADPSLALPVAQACAALADPNTAFALLDGYYFGEGTWRTLSPAGGDQDRSTNRLFQPPSANLWRDARFERLLDRIGLTDYWRNSGTSPDYKRLG